MTTKGRTIRAAAIAVVAALALASCASPPRDTRDEVFEALQTSVNISALDHDPVEGAWGCCLLSESVFERAAEVGYTAVRLPVRFSAHQDAEPPYAIDEEYLERVDWAVDTATAHGLTVIIDNHHWGSSPRGNVDALFADPAANHDQFLAIWSQVAPRYADRDANVVFEVLNEPHDNLDTVWGEYQAEALEIIRETNPRRTVILTGGEWSQARRLDDIILPDDDANIIVTFHHYGPFEFTHQGADWTGLNLPVGVTYDDGDIGKVIGPIATAARYSSEHDVPVLLGEFGAYSAADQDSRVAWATAVRLEAQKRGIATAWWEFNSEGFGVIYGPAGPVRDPALLDATQATADD